MSLGQPIEVADVLFVRMGRDHFCDFRFHAPKMPCKRPPHLGRAGIDCDPIVNDRREQFPEQQRDGVGQHPIQKQNRQLAVQQIKSLVVSPGENTRPLCRSLDGRPQDERQPNEEAQCVARPKCTESCLPPHRFWFRNPASATATLTEGISVLSDEPIEQPSRIAKGEPLSHSTNEPSRREQTRQTSDGVPADMDFAFGSDNMQLPQAFIHLEPGVHRWKGLCADGQADGLVLAVESTSATKHKPDKSHIARRRGLGTLCLHCVFGQVFRRCPRPSIHA